MGGRKKEREGGMEGGRKEDAVREGARDGERRGAGSRPRGDYFAGIGEDLQRNLAFVRRKEVAHKRHRAHLRVLWFSPWHESL